MPSTEREHAAHGADLAPVGVARGRHGVVVAEQLVGAVDEINVQRRLLGSQYTGLARYPVRCRRPRFPIDAARSSRCSPSSPTSCPPAARFSTSRSGTASARSSFAAATTCSSRAATCGRSIATFPSCTTRCSTALPDGCVVDGEIVIATPRGLDFDALQLRLHPAASRVAKLAQETPASFVAFDALAVGRPRPARAAAERAPRALETAAGGRSAADPPHADDARPRASRPSGSRASRAPASTASSPSPTDGTYQPGKRAMIKVKHARTADCVVAGFRWHKDGKDELVGSLLLGLYDDSGTLHHVGVTSAFTMAVRRQLADELAPLRERRARRPSLARLGRRRRRARRACPAARAAGAPARICRGSRCGSSASAR